MRTRIIQPPPVLRNLIRYFWTLELPALPKGHFTIRTFSDDSSGIIFHQSHGSALLQESGNVIPQSMIYGIATTPSVTHVRAPFTAIGALFQPHALRSVTGVDAHYLTDRIYPIREFSKRFDFTEQILNEPDIHKQLAIITCFLQRNAATKYVPDLMVVGAIELMQSFQSRKVRELTKYFKISERQLERRFITSTGITPSHYLRTIRLQQTIGLMRAGKFDKFADLAHHLEFTDQPHFNRLVRELSGMSPRKLQSSLQDEIINLLIEESQN
ncbi:MAG TPA: DUF6597 domain-containing transcriptional factor [Chryseolinea sp.]